MRFVIVTEDGPQLKSGEFSHTRSVDYEVYGLPVSRDEVWNYTAAWLGNAKDEELAEAGIWKVSEPDDEVPPGHFKSGEQLVGDGPFSIINIYEPVPLPSLPDLRAGKIKALADLRWQKTQTFTYDGENDVPADPAMGVITSIAVVEQMMSSNGAKRTFKLKAGVFRQWSVAEIIQYGMAIGAHVQACFNREAELYAKIMAAKSSEDLIKVDILANWP